MAVESVWGLMQYGGGLTCCVIFVMHVLSWMGSNLISIEDFFDPVTKMVELALFADRAWVIHWLFPVLSLAKFLASAYLHRHWLEQQETAMHTIMPYMRRAADAIIQVQQIADENLQEKQEEIQNSECPELEKRDKLDKAQKDIQTLFKKEKDLMFNLMASSWNKKTQKKWVPGANTAHDLGRFLFFLTIVVFVSFHFRVSRSSVLELLRHSESPDSTAAVVVYVLVVLVDMPVPRVYVALKEVVTSSALNLFANILVNVIVLTMKSETFDMQDLLCDKHAMLTFACLLCLARAHECMPWWTVKHQLVLELVVCWELNIVLLIIALFLVVPCMVSDETEDETDFSHSTQLWRGTSHSYTMILLFPLSYLFLDKGYHYCWIKEITDTDSSVKPVFYHDEYKQVVWWFNGVAFFCWFVQFYRQIVVNPVWHARIQRRRQEAQKRVIGSHVEETQTLSTLQNLCLLCNTANYRELSLAVLFGVLVYTTVLPASLQVSLFQHSMTTNLLDVLGTGDTSPNARSSFWSFLAKASPFAVLGKSLPQHQAGKVQCSTQVNA